MSLFKRFAGVDFQNISYKFITPVFSALLGYFRQKMYLDMSLRLVTICGMCCYKIDDTALPTFMFLRTLFAMLVLHALIMMGITTFSSRYFVKSIHVMSFLFT
ncbi:hypothetical protein Mapa_017162 [Marchantia paleacea]|nr:hypothetical protein Mapa_017162 [Marchantia paleacea]